MGVRRACGLRYYRRAVKADYHPVHDGNVRKERERERERERAMKERRRGILRHHREEAKDD